MSPPVPLHFSDPAPSAVPSTLADVRTRLLGDLNSALRRPGMYAPGHGGVALVEWIMHTLAYLDGLADLGWFRQECERRDFFSNAGVSGVMRRFLEAPGAHDVLSVHAEIARNRGWLRPDRPPLPSQEYRDLRARLEEWADRDRTHQDVLEAFGPPTLHLGGSSPLYGKAVGYHCEDPAESTVFFHLWNSMDSGLEQPILLATRVGAQDPDRTFRLTPEGERRRPTPDSFHHRPAATP